MSRFFFVEVDDSLAPLASPAPEPKRGEMVALAVPAYKGRSAFAIDQIDLVQIDVPFRALPKVTRVVVALRNSKPVVMFSPVEPAVLFAQLADKQSI